jgi:plasmid stabilization system protein ParE
LLTAEAAQELEAVFEHYLEHAGAGVAGRFLLEFERAALLVDQYPGVGTPTKKGRRIFPIRRYPYSLIYRSTSEGARIGAVASQHRGPGYWRGVFGRR